MSSLRFECVLRKEAAIRTQRKGPQFRFLVPLIYAPILPLSKSSRSRCCNTLLVILNLYYASSCSRSKSPHHLEEESGAEGSALLRRFGRCFRPWNIFGVSFSLLVPNLSRRSVHLPSVDFSSRFSGFLPNSFF